MNPRLWPGAPLVIVCMGLLLPVAGCGPGRTTGAGMLRLENARVRLGVLPRVGGRAVLLQRRGGSNVLFVDPARLREPASTIPPGRVQASKPWFFKSYHGHITWVGPQQEWWSHQDLLPGRRGKPWPPDPYLLYARCRVRARTRRRLALELPPSRVCGLRLTKEYRLADKGRVLVEVTAVNARPTPVKWDLWSNTRVPLPACVYLAHVPGGYRVEAGGEKQGLVPPAVSVAGGLLCVDSSTPPPAGKRGHVGKVFAQVRAGAIVAFVGDTCFVKRVPLVQPAALAPGQANVEIWYRHLPGKDATECMELENHGPCRALAPGQAMSLREIWQLLPYPGPATTAGHLRFIEEHGLLPIAASGSGGR